MKKTLREYASAKKRPQYFAFFLECCEMISLLEDEAAGRVIHAVADYFRDGTEPDNLARNEKIVFDRIGREIIRSVEAWETQVDAGSRGGKAKAANARTERPADPRKDPDMIFEDKRAELLKRFTS